MSNLLKMIQKENPPHQFFGIDLVNDTTAGVRRVSLPKKLVGREDPGSYGRCDETYIKNGLEEERQVD